MKDLVQAIQCGFLPGFENIMDEIGMRLCQRCGEHAIWVGSNDAICSYCEDEFEDKIRLTVDLEMAWEDFLETND